jgi:hypothetical protein
MSVIIIEFFMSLADVRYTGSAKRKTPRPRPRGSVLQEEDEEGKSIERGEGRGGVEWRGGRGGREGRVKREERG